MYFKIQRDQPKIPRNALESQIFKFYLCPDNDLVNISKI